MLPRRPWCRLMLACALGLLSAPACGGAPTRLVTVKSGGAEGPIQLEVKNLTDVPINNFFLAKSESIPHDLDNAAPEAQGIWGADLLSAAIPVGSRVPVPVPGPGRWDARALDRDGRYQHVAALKLEAGGRYILELSESSWRVGH